MHNVIYICVHQTASPRQISHVICRCNGRWRHLALLYDVRWNYLIRSSCDVLLWNISRGLSTNWLFDDTVRMKSQLSLFMRPNLSCAATLPVIIYYFKTHGAISGMNILRKKNMFPVNNFLNIQCHRVIRNSVLYRVFPCQVCVRQYVMSRVVPLWLPPLDRGPKSVFEDPKE